ncbi:MAG TPA: D-aminoacylase, partial [Planctomycetota bacterium]
MPPRSAADYDVVLRGGRIVDGSGAPAFVADLGLRGDRIAALGDLSGSRGVQEVDCSGLVVAPGFINVLSWAVDSLLVDGRALSDLRQGVTLEVFGEGWSMGPLTEAMVAEQLSLQGDLRYEIPWRTLGGYLEHLEARGVVPNVASFVGATTVRMFVLDQDDRPPTPAELVRMQELVATAMEEGALGVGSSLIYAPAFYAGTDELIALMQTAARYGGRYITHMRSEGNRLLEALDEVERIVRAAGCGAEIYHLKAAGRANWPKMDQVIARVDALRAEGLDLTADMYTYTAGATGLDASMPPWVQEGGYEAWAERMQDPAVRARVVAEMRAESDDWENLLLAAGSSDKVLLVSFKNDALKPYTGKSLAEVAALRGTTPEETAIDLVIEDGSRVGTVYFLMSEDNVERQLALPWVSLGSDAGGDAPEGVFLKSNPHPRT